MADNHNQEQQLMIAEIVAESNKSAERMFISDHSAEIRQSELIAKNKLTKDFFNITNELKKINNLNDKQIQSIINHINFEFAINAFPFLTNILLRFKKMILVGNYSIDSYDIMDYKDLREFLQSYILTDKRIEDIIFPSLINTMQFYLDDNPEFDSLKMDEIINISNKTIKIIGKKMYQMSMKDLFTFYELPSQEGLYDLAIKKSNILKYEKAYYFLTKIIDYIKSIDNFVIILEDSEKNSETIIWQRNKEQQKTNDDISYDGLLNFIFSYYKTRLNPQITVIEYREFNDGEKTYLFDKADAYLLSREHNFIRQLTPPNREHYLKYASQFKRLVDGKIIKYEPMNIAKKLNIDIN